MGWFSNSKKQQESKPKESPKKEFTKCPVCECNTFEKVDYFSYFKDEGQKLGDTQIISHEKFDCKAFVGENTGACSNCGGIVRGLIFQQNSEETKSLMRSIVGECNKAFCVFIDGIAKEVKSGNNAVKLKPFYDTYVKDNAKNFDRYNMKAHLIIAFNGANLRFAPEINAQLENLLQSYKNILGMAKTSLASGSYSEIVRESIDRMIDTTASFTNIIK